MSHTCMIFRSRSVLAPAPRHARRLAARQASSDRAPNGFAWMMPRCLEPSEIVPQAVDWVPLMTVCHAIVLWIPCSEEDDRGIMRQ